MSDTTPMQKTESNSYHEGCGQINMPERNTPAYPPAYPPADLNPYHVGYDQNNARSYGQNAPLPPQPANAITMQPLVTTVSVQQPDTPLVVSYQRGSDLTLPSILVCFFCCWCTGFPAIILAVLAQNRYGEGRWQEAEDYQRKARYLMVTSVIFSWGALVLAFIIYFAVIASSNSY